jgi:segregation and condensation protein B
MNMNQVHKQIESLLFIAGKPMSAKRIAEILNVAKDEVKHAAEELVAWYGEQNRGIMIMSSHDTYQMATAPDAAKLITDFIKSEQSGELTKPSLETLTIIAYRGPVSKMELEQIRGVNCSLILRNLLIKGLIEAEFDRKQKQTVYTITLPFLEFLGLRTREELPQYKELSSDERLQTLLQNQMKETVSEHHDVQQP